MDGIQQKTVLVFTTAYLPHQGGAEIAVYETAKRLTDYRFIILTSRFSLKFPAHEYRKNIKIIRLGLGTRFDKFLLPLLAFLKGNSLLRENRVRTIPRQPALLWGVMISQGSVAAYFLKSFHKNIPLLITLQEGDSERHIARGRLGLIGFFWRKILHRADAVQAISRYLADLATSYGFHKEVHIIPNGVDAALFSKEYPYAQAAKLRKRLGIGNNELVLISVSRLVEKNGLEDIISAIALLSNVKLLLAGDGNLRERLKKQSERLGVSERVLFLGNVPHEETPLYLKSAYCFIRPSRSEGLGSAFLEAMAAGLPVIATPIGGIRDFIIDGETGLFVDVDDPEGIARAVERLIDDQELYRRLRENSQKLVSEKYQWDYVAGGIRHIFNELQA